MSEHLLHPTIDPQEIEKFSQMANEWWDLNGKFRPLHKLNPTRIHYIRQHINNHFPTSELNQLSLLDVGCGGGLIAEPMANLGLNVTAIDASEKNIYIAQTHATQANIAINYQYSTIEDQITNDNQYDVVLALEIVEHVADLELFIQQCCQTVKLGGLLIMSTINKTTKSYLLAILGAEYILRWLPIGTHSWQKFLAPSTLGRHIQKNGIQLKEVKGLSFNPLQQTWRISSDTSVNYMLTAHKK